MKKSEIKVGATYLMNHSSGRINVRILAEKSRHVWNADGGRNMSGWKALNLKTGREIEIKSAQKLLKEISPAPGGRPQAETSAETRHGTIAIGDRVGYSVDYLRSTGQQTGPIPFERGEVIGFANLGSVTLAIVKWDNSELMPDRVHVANLANTRMRQLGH